MEQPSLPEHEDLLLQWKKDSEIDRTQLLSELYRSPLVHSKYLSRHQGYKVLLRKKYMKYEKLKALKTRYFHGELSKEELDSLGWSQYLFKKPLKSELDTMMGGDPDIQKIKEEIEYLGILIESCESIMKEIHSRNFLMKNIIELMKFEAGG